MDGATPDLLAPLLQRQRLAHARRVPDYAQRIDDLKRLRAAVKKRSEDIVAAIAADFGRRSRHETLLSDVMTVLHDIDHAASHLKRWMKPRRVLPDWTFLPASAQIRYQPVGVVGIISPWNYPVNLALMPLAAALAAGNHAMLKPSELTPRTSDLLKAMLADVFPEERVAVVLGGPEVASFKTLLEYILKETGRTCMPVNVPFWAARLQANYDDLEARIAELAAREDLGRVRPDLDGNAIMELLGIPAGPQVGEAWNYLKELRLDRGPLSRDEATAELLAWWNARGGADV